MSRTFPWAMVLCVVGAVTTWIACKGGSNDESSAADAAADAEDAGEDASVDSSIGSSDSCDPCYSVCSCSPGDQWPAPQACATYVCGPAGTWGIFECLGSGCPSDDAGPLDAASDASKKDAEADGATDGSVDVTPDASSDGASDLAADSASE